MAKNEQISERDDDENGKNIYFVSRARERVRALLHPTTSTRIFLLLLLWLQNAVCVHFAEYQ